ncbi:MAG: 2-amino-4-hydroxy-6-hydroxymethyldihydropteridine diphosphokinase [Saprospiraceae bacterium]|nr:2-amino-4-hydroxy-6-hydroxymethyldihydropteridine diphosphokinase [Saprospiraceae bacterium]
MSTEPITHLLLGSNVGDRKLHLDVAKQYISKDIGHIVSESSIYESSAWGGDSVADQADYINQAIGIKTNLSPNDLLNSIKQIEKIMGRESTEKWASRIIDIDILLMESLIVDSENLKIPHHLLHERNFALIPLLEIAAYSIHPKFGLTIEELYEQSKDNIDVLIYEAP